MTTITAGQTATLTAPLVGAIYVQGGTLNVDTTLSKNSVIIANGGTININESAPWRDLGVVQISDGSVLNLCGPMCLGPSETIDMYCNEPNASAPTINVRNLQPEANSGANVGSNWNGTTNPLAEITATQGELAVPNQGLNLALWDLGPGQWGTYSLFNSYDQWASYSHTWTMHVYGFGFGPQIGFDPQNP